MRVVFSRDAAARCCFCCISRIQVPSIQPCDVVDVRGGARDCEVNSIFTILRALRGFNTHFAAANSAAVNCDDRVKLA